MLLVAVVVVAMADLELWVRTALSLGVVPAELASEQSVRSALAQAVGGQLLDSGQWAQVRAGVAEGVARASRGQRSLAGECSQCSAPVWWVRTEATGSRMPLDPLPHPRGTFVFVPSSRKPDVVRALPHGHPVPERVRAFRVHFATCPSQQAQRAKRQGPRRCESCGEPMHQLLHEAGEVRHPGCETPAQTNERIRRERAAAREMEEQ